MNFIGDGSQIIWCVLLFILYHFHRTSQVEARTLPGQQLLNCHAFGRCIGFFIFAAVFFLLCDASFIQSFVQLVTLTLSFFVLISKTTGRYLWLDRDLILIRIC